MDVFGGAPRFLAYPRPLVVQNGTDAALKCQIAGDPRPAVIWERANKKLHPDGRYRLFEDGNVYNLIISRVGAEDSGQYICKAKNSIGETYAAATLKVEGEAQEKELREENRPRFLIKPLSVRVGRGEDAVFSCKLWGKPRPEIIWEKDGKKLNDIFESAHFSIGHQDGGWFQLKVFQTRAPDAGIYTCRARNEYGEALAGAVLLVDAGPGHEEEAATRNGYANGHWKHHQGKRGSRFNGTHKIEEPAPSSAKVKMFKVSEGKHAKFRCYVTGKPKPEIVWRKDGVVIMSGRRYLLYEDREGYFTLKVLYCKQQDNGLYVCAASNTAGQTLSAVHLNVKEPALRFKQPLNDVEVRERQLAVLECEVSVDTVPTTWYLEDRRLQAGAKYGIEQCGTVRRLTIRDIGADDDGIYLCEMADGGRSIAEVSVRGTIVRKLPRKVDLLEGENAAFCVEVEEEEMDIHWYKDGLELRETHQTILKSFGKTHILVFVNATPQDSGIVTFVVGRSKTSSQLRVKAVRQSPPSCPVCVQMNTERSNSALLSWVPAHDSRKNPPTGYVLERQEVGSQEWLQCLTTDLASAVEILGDSVPSEADYRFRICSVNKYGRSGHVEFSSVVHLVPVARIKTPLQDVLVPEGKDAKFSIELSALVIGTWFLNGSQIQEDERYTIHRSRTEHSLLLKATNPSDNRSEITFIAYGVRDSAMLYVQPPPVKFEFLPEMDRNKKIEAGSPVVLYCELSDANAQVHWYKDGVELHTQEGIHVQSEGTMRRLVIQSADFSHSGEYRCDAIDDVLKFNMEVEAPRVKFAALSLMDRHKSIESGSPIELCCELSNPNTQVCWYKDGTELHPQDGLDIQSEGTKRQLVIQSAEVSHSGVYSCDAVDDVIKFNVDVEAPPVKFAALSEMDRHKSIESGSPVELCCELSNPKTRVHWYKDGTELHPQEGFDIQSVGSTRRLVIQSAEVSHSGVYSCDAVDDVIKFNVHVKAPPVKFAALSESDRNKSIELGSPIELCCELSNPNTRVHWYKDGTELHPQEGFDIQSVRSTRRLVIQSAEVSHSGVYCCDAVDDVIKFNVAVEAPPVKFAALSEMDRHKSIESGSPIELCCELSNPKTRVHWYKDGTELHPQEGFDIQSVGSTRRLVIQSAEVSHSGVYSCDAVDDVIKFNVHVKAPPVKFAALSESDRNKSIESGSPIELCCELSNPNTRVRWYKDGVELHPQKGFDIQSEGSTRRLNIQSAEVSHSGLYSCDAVDDVIKFNVDVEAYIFIALLKTLLCRASPLLASQWFHNGLVIHCSTQILLIMCPAAPPVKFNPLPEADLHRSIVESSPVVLYCEVSRPDAPVRWYKDGIEIQPRDGITVQSDNTMRRLVIQSSKLFDSGVYTCHAVDDAVIFNVNIREPPVTVVHPREDVHMEHQVSERIVLSCELSRSNAAVHWYKDGQELLESDDVILESEGPHRRLIILQGRTEDSGEYVCDTADDSIFYQVTVIEPAVQIMSPSQSPMELEFLTEECVVLSCEVSRPNAYVRWYQDGLELEETEDLILETEGVHRRLIIPKAAVQDSAEYICDAVDDSVTFMVKITEPPVKFVWPHKAPGVVKVFVGDPVVLECEVSRSNAVVSWRKEGQEMEESREVTIEENGVLRQLIIHSPKLEDSGNYYCDAKDETMDFRVKVTEAPVQIKRKGELKTQQQVMVSGYVVLECELSRANGTVKWYKDGEKITDNERVCLEEEGAFRSLVILNAETSDSGEYFCDACDDSVVFHVCVKESPVTIIGNSDSPEHHSLIAGDDLVLTCELSRSNATVEWYCNGKPLSSEDSRICIETLGSVRQLVISGLQPSDSAEYICDAGDDKMVTTVTVKVPRVVEVIAELHNITVLEGEDATFKCVVSPEDAELVWHRNGNVVVPDEKFVVSRNGLCHTLTIRDCQLTDSSKVTAEAEGVVSKANLQVQEAQVLFTKKMEAVIAEEHGEATLEVEVSLESGEVQWMRQGVVIQPSPKFTLSAKGRKRSLTVRNLTLSDQGTFRCETLHDRTQGKLNVEPRKISIKKGLADLETLERETASFEVEVSHVDVQGVWQKDGIRIKPNKNWRVSTHGRVHALTLSNLTLEDSGTITFSAESVRTSARLSVKEPPVMFLRALEDLQIPESSGASFECELSRQNADVKWLKNGQELKPGKNYRIYSMGRKRFLQIIKCEIVDSGTYTCDAVDSKVTAVLDVYEREVEIVQGLQDAAIQEDENAVFMCEVSLENVKGEWLRNGEKIRPTSTVRIRQEGNKHFLLICNVKTEDSGKITFIAKQAESTANLEVEELPVQIVKPLHDKTALEKHRVILECTVSNPRCSVRWYQGETLILPSDHYEICSEGCYRKLVIQQVTAMDEGTYSVQVGKHESSARLLVEG
ncbi:hypothetical protein AOXY_G14087 [Acipenser oxyrinchus oxyrinchus]|uniref:Obscurin-like protein 1 n=1 Tax=Acipenser oxyrinchus oxyrinchus TaxID=40147 RepID=A0AAD8G591_ACIOX|nr:hypothetical protein AOXY_G14087 [Acipenser oxyrinchus oxyrinchus]